MKKYLLNIEDKNEELWQKFKMAYKDKNIANNLDGAIFVLIKKFVK